MYKVYECDYHERSFLLGEVEALEDARKIGRQALKKSKREFPCFIADGEKFIEDIR